MGFVAAKCTQCGADIRVDDSREAGVCEHCNTTFVTDRAINHIYNQTIQAGSIKIQTETVEQLLSKAETYLKIGNSNKAVAAYQKVCDSYPDDYRAYWGLLLVATKGFTLLPRVFDQSFVNLLHYYIKCIYILCKDEQMKKMMMMKIEPYLQKLSLEYARGEFDIFKMKIDVLEQTNKNDKERIEKLEKEARKKAVNSLVFTVLAVALLVCLFRAEYLIWAIVSGYVLVIPCLSVLILARIRMKKVRKNNEPARMQISSRESTINECRKNNFEHFAAINKNKLSINGLVNLK